MFRLAHFFVENASVEHTLGIVFFFEGDGPMRGMQSNLLRCEPAAMNEAE